MKRVKAKPDPGWRIYHAIMARIELRAKLTLLIQAHGYNTVLKHIKELKP